MSPKLSRCQYSLPFAEDALGKETVVRAEFSDIVVGLNLISYINLSLFYSLISFVPFKYYQQGDDFTYRSRSLRMKSQLNISLNVCNLIAQLQGNV